MLRRSLSAGPSVPVLFMPIGSPEARSSEGVDAGRDQVKGHENERQHWYESLEPLSRSSFNTFKWEYWYSVGVIPPSSSICLPRDADPSRPGWPILPFSFFPKSRPMEDLMLFFLLDLWRESWLLLELLPSAERLGGTKEFTKGKKLEKVFNCRFWQRLMRPLPYLRNSRGSSSIAPGWVRVILSSRSARGVDGGVESRTARDRSSSLLFWKRDMRKESWEPLIPRSLEPFLGFITENWTAWRYPLLPLRKQTNSGQKHHIPPRKMSLLGWDLMSSLRRVPARVPAHYPDVIVSIKRPGKMTATVKHPHLKDECIVPSTRQEN